MRSKKGPEGGGGGWPSQTRCRYCLFSTAPKRLFLYTCGTVEEVSSILPLASTPGNPRVDCQLPVLPVFIQYTVNFQYSQYFASILPAAGTPSASPVPVPQSTPQCLNAGYRPSITSQHYAMPMPKPACTHYFAVPRTSTVFQGCVLTLLELQSRFGGKPLEI